MIHPDFFEAYDLIYKPYNLVYENLKAEPESKEYGGCSFDIDNQHIKFRVSKITPTKKGQFVTFYKRNKNGIIIPYDTCDHFDKLIISTRENNYFGFFIFPKHVLYENGLLSKEGKGGKRALRIYPPWAITENKQAQKTQLWQIKYYISA